MPSEDIPAGDTFRLFVYGTLMRGGPRHHLLAGQRFVGEARTLPGYDLFHLGDYPGLVYCTPGRSIRGEVYEVQTTLIPRLDHAEGAPTLYRLGPVGLEGFAGPVYAYIYLQPTDGFSPCAGDRWQEP